MGLVSFSCVSRSLLDHVILTLVLPMAVRVTYKLACSRDITKTWSVALVDIFTNTARDEKGAHVPENDHSMSETLLVPL